MNFYSKFIYRIVCLALIGLASPVCSADTVALSPQTIKAIETGWGGEGIYVFTDQNLQTGSCTQQGVMMDTSAPMFKETTAILLTALQARDKVTFFVDGCEDNHMKLIAVQVNEPG